MEYYPVVNYNCFERMDFGNSADPDRLILRCVFLEMVRVLGNLATFCRLMFL